MPRLVKTRAIQNVEIGDPRQTDFYPPSPVPADFDFSTIPGSRFAKARLPKNMPSPLNISAVGDIEQIKASGVKWMRLCVYVLDGDVWKHRSVATRDFSFPAPVGRPDEMIRVSLDIPRTNNEQHPLSDRDICVVGQVLGATITVGVDIESG